MQSVAMSRSISPSCGMDFILSRFLARGAKVGEDLVEVRLAESGAVWLGSAGDQGDVDVQFLARPTFELLIEVGRGVGKGDEDDHLAVGLPLVLVVGCLTLCSMSFFSSASLASRSGVHRRSSTMARWRVAACPLPGHAANRRSEDGPSRIRALPT